MNRFAFGAPLLLLAACASTGSTDTTGTDTAGDTADTSTDTAKDTGRDTGDTDTGKDTGKDTGVDTSDTGNPDTPKNGYYGQPTLGIVADDGAGGANVYVMDAGATTLTKVPDLTVGVNATIACAGSFLWVLDPQTGSTAESAYGIDGHTGALVRTLALPAGFGARALAFSNGSFWFGGDGSANLVSFEEAGTEGPTVDLSSLADSDGLPEVRGFVPAGAGLGVILARTTGASYGTSKIAAIDLAAGTILGSGDLAGGNAGSTATGIPGGVMVETLPHGAVAGALEGFDLTSYTSSGTILDYTGSTRVASVAGGNDGTVWVALKSGGTTTLHHYFADGTELGSFTTHTEAEALAPFTPKIYSGEGTGTATAVVPYDMGAGTAGTPVVLGATIKNMFTCQPPPGPPDTGADTAKP